MIRLLVGEQSNRVMSRSTNYGARISAPDDLFWRAALVTSGNLQWRAALRSVTAEMAARYPNTWRYHLNIWPPQWTMTSLKRPRSVSRASRRPVNGKKKLIDQETWGFTVQQSRNPTNDYSLGSFTCRHFSKKISSIRRQHYAIRRLSWIDRPFKASWNLIRSANQLIMATHNIQMRRFVSRMATLAIWHGGAIRRAAGSWFYFYLMRRTFRHGATAVSHANNTSIFRTINEALLNVDNALCHLDHLPICTKYDSATVMTLPCLNTKWTFAVDLKLAIFRYLGSQRWKFDSTE